MRKVRSLKKKKSILVLFFGAVSIMFAASAITPFAPSKAQSPVAASPYSISVFANSPAGLSQPGAVLFANDSVYVAYNNGAALDGSSGSTTVVQYSTTGTVGQMYTISGGNATVKAEPLTGHIWVLQNPIANPSLTIIDPNNNVQNTFTFAPTAHGGGYGDLAFLAGEVYISASNPSANPNTAPAILHVSTSGTMANVTPVLAGNASAIDSLTGSTITLNLVSPLSLEFDSLNDLVLNDQVDSQLIFVHNPNEADQSVYRTALNLNSNPVEIGNTAFVSSANGMLLVSDPGAGTIYSVTRAVFSEGKVYTTAPGAVEKVDLDSGDVNTKIVTGLVSPSRVAFVPNSEFRLSFSPGGPSVSTSGGTVLVIAETNRQGDPGNITITAPNGLPKGFKFATADPLVLSGGTGVVEIKVKGSAGAGVHGIPFTATDSSGRVRRATMLVQVGP
jgi:hypothetical protein